MHGNSFAFFSGFRDHPGYQNLSRPLIFCDDLRTPENMGAVLRLAGNIGVRETVFFSEKAKDFKSYKINRTASGGSEKTNWQILPGTEVELTKMIPKGYRIVALETVPEATNLLTTPLPEKVAFLIGNEISGISDKLLKQADQTVFVPVPGPVSSLNVTHALSVALFEWLRQRKINF